MRQIWFYCRDVHLWFQYRDVHLWFHCRDVHCSNNFVMMGQSKWLLAHTPKINNTLKKAPKKPHNKYTQKITNLFVHFFKKKGKREWNGMEGWARKSFFCSWPKQEKKLRTKKGLFWNLLESLHLCWRCNQTWEEASTLLSSLNRYLHTYLPPSSELCGSYLPTFLPST